MAKSPFRILKITGIILLILAGILVIANSVLSRILENKISEKLEAQQLHIKTISVSLFSRSIEIDSLYTLASPDSAHLPPHHAVIQKIKIAGIHVYRALAKHELIINTISLSDGYISYNRILKNPKADTLQKTPGTEIKVIEIKDISIKHLKTAIVNDSVQETSGEINLELKDIAIAFGADTTYKIGQVEALLLNVKHSKTGALQALAASRINYSSKTGHLEADTFRIIPNYNKAEFARIAGIQKTRLDIMIPKTIIDGINYERLFSDTTVAIERITVPAAVIHAYRDKRYPFIRDWIMPLPIEGIRRLPFKVKVDSILIDNASIAYEEFPEKGFTTGTITFDDLNASFAGLSTEEKQPAKDLFWTLFAKCKVMNNGSLQATFKFPLNKSVNYEASGNIKNWDLKTLNPTLGNLTQIEIREGVLNNLHYNFSYNDDVSTGEVLINYENLNLQALKKEKEREVNKLLTTVINAVVKSDKDKSVDKSKRTGSINIERDKRRFVFQFWWKSLQDGLESTFLTKNGKKKKAQDGPSS